jgi:hypothetical protein
MKVRHPLAAGRHYHPPYYFKEKPEDKPEVFCENQPRRFTIVLYAGLCFYAGTYIMGPMAGRIRW